MADNNKKRDSFRKLFPMLFFSNKNKQKSINDTHVSKKVSTKSGTSRDNQYQNPRSVLQKHEAHNTVEEDDDRVYENLSTVSRQQNVSNYPNNHSSSSTLVSENVTPQHENTQVVTITSDRNDYKYIARPQVPPRLMNEVQLHTPLNTVSNTLRNNPYPDVYYHSLEKLKDIKPINETEIYEASRSQINPASVGAEIKKVSTRFLISPKKEAEVRTIQPTRARSLSLDKEKLKSNGNYNKQPCKNFEKPYNYSAPSTPVAVNNKIPNMPATSSPYEQVRKTMIEAEERRNSVSRCSSRNKFTPSPMLLHGSSKSSNENVRIGDTMTKEKTRKQVEAFYWHKIVEMKLKEDEYLLKQSINNNMRMPRSSQPTYSTSNCSTPTSFVTDPRSCSLPRGNEINQAIYSSPFTRGAMERRTDSFITNKTVRRDPHIVYRHQEPSQQIVKTKIFDRGSLTRDPVVLQQSKRVSFDNPMYRGTVFNSGTQRRDVTSPELGHKEPPRPPIRTSSAVSANKNHRLVSNNRNTVKVMGGPHSICSESESGSEAGEIQRIMQNNGRREEDWQSDPRLDGGQSDTEAGRGPPRGRPSRRDDPRRHTLAGNHLYTQQSAITGLDEERYRVANVNIPEYAVPDKNRIMKPYPQIYPRMKKPPLPRYLPAPSNMLFEDDPGVMSEVETSSTGFRRGGKQRSSLPVVRTPSKTLERPLGLVFLQYRSETKRALLPNEVTSIDTVKALFVRSFQKQLTMQYMDSDHVKIYIHDTSKDMFYELEDDRAHLRDIRDRSVLRLFEATDMGGGVFPGSVGASSVAMPSTSSWDQDQNYFSEPEIDSDYHHQHVHNKSKVKAPAYYMGTPAPSTLPRGGSLLRAFSPAAPPVPADRVKALPPGPTAPSKPVRSYIPGSGSERCFPFASAECPRGTDQLYSIPAHSGDGYMSSPERSAPRPYEDPYYTQFLGPSAGRTGIAPVIDEEANDSVIIDDAYQMYGVNAITTAPRPMPRPGPFERLGAPLEDMQRLRVEKMERQLANLTGLVQKALQVPAVVPAPPAVAPRQEYQPYAARPATQDAARFASTERPPKLGKDRFQKSVSFEKSVSFSDDPPDMNSPKQHSPQHSADTKPTKPAIKSSTLPRTSSQERDRLKPAPPPKPVGLVGQQLPLPPQKTCTLNVNPDFFNQLRSLQKQSRDLRIETRNLRRSTLNQSMQMRQLMADTITKIGAIAASFCQEDPDSQLTREEEIYRQDMLLLENDLYELEATVERLRGQAANSCRETRVNMADIERIAMVLSKSSKTVADWKLKFPILQETMKTKLAGEMEKVVRKEKMLEDEPERLELALRRCKKLTGTLVTLKRLACVQEQRLPVGDGRVSPSSSQSSITVGPSSEEYTSETACTSAPTNKPVLDTRSSLQNKTSIIH
ncbi:coiled-coil domain-containing protein AGAP005037 isoform X13 [Danaus plexippus]|uniref:coiled-coil domain-containing protein AGAP005037 isoform X13 n=1 Tax=Danaus plexippus TaxID=13037 RepID=UPI002AB094BA|nr:coiled-coil domain-containing protein AGAP005037 isoform X13 [Danaus plexippus]